MASSSKDAMRTPPPLRSMLSPRISIHSASLSGLHSLYGDTRTCAGNGEVVWFGFLPNAFGSMLKPPADAASKMPYISFVWKLTRNSGMPGSTCLM